MKKLYYIVKSNLHYYPPCVSQIRMLHDLGADVTVLYGSSERSALDLLDQEGIPYCQLADDRGRLPGKLDKISNWLTFRRALKQYLRSVDQSNAVLWFGTAESLLPMSGALNGWQYIASFLELLDQQKGKLRALRPMAQKASTVTTCEETRSYLMQYWFGLKRLPYTIPNKPYNVPCERGSDVTTEAGKKILEATKGHPYVIYQGIFQNPEYMTALAQVLHDHYPEMFLVLMGIDKYHIADQVKKIHANTVVSGYIPAPLHLQVTANAHIGVLYYKPDELNKAFCAPNKIFEYSYFGLPIIGNDIPGLKNTIGKAGAGVCIDFSYESVLHALQTIEEKYERISKNAVAFYHSVDNVATIRKIAAENQLIREECQ